MNIIRRQDKEIEQIKNKGGKMKIQIGSLTIKVPEENLKDAVFELADEDLKKKAILSLLDKKAGRPKGTSHKKVGSKKGVKKVHWTNQEDNFLKQNYYRLTISECQKKLSPRTYEAIKGRIQSLGLGGTKRKR